MKKLLYLQISEEILNQIVNGDLKPGSKVMSVREMALEKKVNPKTIQKAFEYLEGLDAFYTKVGEGRFITDDEAIINALKLRVITDEINQFVDKAMKYELSLDEIIEKIKESYDR